MRHPSLLKHQAAERRKSRARKKLQKSPPEGVKEAVSLSGDQSYWAINKILVKAIVSVIIVAACLWVQDHPASFPKEISAPIKSLAGKTFSFASMQEKWGHYIGYEGTSSEAALYTSDFLYAAPVSSFTDSAMSKQGDQLVIAAIKGESIYATESGIVLFVGKKQNEDTVIIQHADDRQTIYESITPAVLRPFDPVQKGQMIGQAASNDGIKFSVKDSEGFLDPSSLFLENEN
ncbi:M23 family metallopeptidase [Jeotgalibacillus proteolyticus]|nr:M23 family metallopeptidase [Jeotgalibacillus proteolyticus]